MPLTDVAPDLRLLVRARARERCEYCGIPEHACFSTLEVDHIIAEQHGGLTTRDNLALACLPCNRRKGPNVASFDPETGELTPLFHPRSQAWVDHFRIETDGRIVGKTSFGRTTQKLLAFNDDRRIHERQLLIVAGVWDRLLPAPRSSD